MGLTMLGEPGLTGLRGRR